MDIEIKCKFPLTDGKKIISFTLYGNNPFYTEGAIQNAILAPYVYPGWTCRFYVDHSVPSNIIESLLDKNCQIYLVKNSKDFEFNPRTKLLWRFLPVGENVRFISRDADSRLNSKEAWATNKWMETEKKFTRIFDIGETNIILGGCWGATSIKNVSAISDIEKKIFEWVNLKSKKRDTDEKFLEQIVLPLLEKSVLDFGDKNKRPKAIKDSIPFLFKKKLRIGKAIFPDSELFKNPDLWYKEFIKKPDH